MWPRRQDDRYAAGRQAGSDEADMRAVRETLRQHLLECADRFKSLQALIVRLGIGIIGLLLTIIGWLLTRSVHFS